MNWKTIAMVAIGSNVGTVAAYTYFEGFNLELALLSGFASLLGAMFLGYISTLGKRE